MKIDKKELYWTIGAWAAFVIFTIIVKTVDVQAIGPEGSKVGLAGLNSGLQAFGYHEIWYKLSKLLGLVSLAVAGGFALLGAWQLVKGHFCPCAVDKGVWLMGGFYVLVIFFYVLFDKVVVNYRPVLEDGQLEASYPSSHTMLAICVLLTATLQFRYRLKKWPKLQFWATLVCWIVMVETVVSRMLSGVHWLTDIMGGILLASALVSLYCLAEQMLMARSLNTDAMS